MIEFTNTVEIDRPVETMFAYLSDLENTPEWNWAIAETTHDPDSPAGVGARYTQRRAAPSESVEQLQITALDAHRRIEVEGDLSRFSAHLVYELAGSGGGTLLTNTVRLEASGPLRLIAPMLAGRISTAVAENLETLKRLLESR